MLKRILFNLFLGYSVHSSAEIVPLLKVPLHDGTFYTYSANLKKHCSFTGVTEIIAPEINIKSKKKLTDKINLLQMKLNFEIKKIKISNDLILLTLNGSNNINFEFSFNPKTCKLEKKIHLDDDVISIDELKIEYSNALQTPVVKKIIIKNNDENKNRTLYPWALHGQISTYEFNIGPAVSIRSNIRKNSHEEFEKNNPVIEPIPAFLFRYGPFFLNKDGLGSLLYHHEDLTILGIALLEGEPYSSTGITDREKGYFLGGILKYNSFQILYYNDFFTEKGYNIKTSFVPEYFVKIDWKLNPQFFIQYWDNKYVDYYFGVNANEMGSGMRKYSGKHTFNYGVLLETTHYVENWTFLMSFGTKLYGHEVFSSPTVTKQNELRFIGSILYKFF